MGVCTTNKKPSSKFAHNEDDWEYKLKKTITINENLERNFPRGAYYFNKQEEK